jgi:hypothetical protein
MVERFDMHMKKVEVGRHIWTRIYADALDDSYYHKLKKGHDKMRNNAPYCKNPEVYDFWWDSAGTWKYENFTCMELCDQSELGPMTYESCFGPYDMIRDISDDGITYVTEVDHFGYGAGSYSQFIPWDLESMNLYFYYGLDLLKQSFFDSDTYRKYMGVDDLEKRYRIGDHGEAVGKILTVIKNSAGKENRLFLPEDEGGDIVISLADVLSLAGVDLDGTPEPGFGQPNQKPGAARPRATPRVSGLKVKAAIECNNNPPSTRVSEMLEERGHDVEAWTSKNDDVYPICEVTFTAISGPWVGKHYKTRSLNGQYKQHFYHGIHVYFTKGGVFGYASFVECFHVLVDLIVLSRVPKLLVLFVACYLMGHTTSKIYHQAVTKRFSIFDEAAGSASRLLTYTFDYHRCADKARGHITKETIAEMLVAATSLELQDSKLKEHEVLAMVNFCYQAMMEQKEPDRFSDFKNLFDFRKLLVGRYAPQNYSHLEGVSSSKFNGSCSSDEDIQFTDLVHLFAVGENSKKKSWTSWTEKMFSEKTVNAFCDHATKSIHDCKETDAIKKIIERAKAEKSGVSYTPRNSKTDVYTPKSELMQRIRNLEFFLNKPCEMPLQEFSAEESMTGAMPNQVNGTLGGQFGDTAHSGELPPGDILLDATDLPMPPGSVFEGQSSKEPRTGGC